MTSSGGLLRGAAVPFLTALVLAACGGPAATAAPTPTPVVTAAPTATPAPTPTPTPIPPTATPGPVDPSLDLEIAAPYTFAPLDPALAEMFITAMEDSLGSMAKVFQVGVRSAVTDGRTAAWVIVMRFPDLPVSEEQLLDGAAGGAVGEGGEAEKRVILGQDVRVFEKEGTAGVLTMVDGDLVMAMGAVKADAIDVITKIIQANG